MSDINPMTGQSLNAPAMEQAEAGPRLNFEGDVPSVVQTEEEREFEHIVRMSQLTKFATGDINRDVKNYLAMKKIGQMMSGMMGEDD